MTMLRLAIILGLAACAFGVRILGGVSHVPLEKLEPNLKKTFIQLAESHFNAKILTVCAGCPQNQHYKFYELTHVTRQVINGLKYKIEFTLLPTECKRPIVNTQNCPFTNSYPPQKCSAVLIDRWDADIELKNMTCVPVVTMLLRSKRSVHERQVPTNLGSYASFTAFKQKYGRVYLTRAEEMKRYQVYHENMKKAQILNELEMGTAVYGQSPFADMTEAEFRHTHLSPLWDQSKMPSTPAKIPLGATPTSFDWRQHNAVTPVKNQEQCGSCWAFSTTGNIEGQWAIQKKNLISLSEQELVDCDKVDQGCGGGLPSNAYKVIMKMGGLESEQAYPYEARNDTCKFKPSLIRAYINGSVALPQDETKLAAWLAQNGPISIGINAFAMQFYMGGISHPWSFLCSPSNLDHGVLLVGYGVQGSEPYWIVKNSWGPSWGEKGYYLVYRGSGVCGLNRMATSAVVH